MKKYIKPNLEIVQVKTESLLDIASVQGADDIKRGQGYFGGGAADSRDGGYWDDED